MARIGFVGLGNMGGPMAANLVRAGHNLKGFDLVPAACEQAAQSGIEIVRKAEAAAADADAVITMLPAGGNVLEVYHSELVWNAMPDTLFIDCSTIDVNSARRAHSIARDARMASVDAPVSGGVSGASSGTLTFMVGGEISAVERAKPLLSAMGKNIVYCGPAGTGQAAKICNNMVLGISMIAVSEAFVLAEQLGLSVQALFEVISKSSGQCWAVTNYCPVPGPVLSSPANNGYRPGFSATLMLKDLELARESEKMMGMQAALGQHAADIYSAYTAAGFGSSDFSGIINHIRAEREKRCV
jgi:3-hydroxyisobutyrate dehydrogenase